jgi:hypothetical protein
VENCSHEAGKLVARELPADVLAHLLPSEGFNIGSSLNACLDFNVWAWRPSLTLHDREDALFGSFTPNLPHRQEGAERVQQVLVESIARKVRSEPFDRPRVANLWLSVGSMPVRTVNAAYCDRSRRLQGKNDQLAVLHPMNQGPKLRNVGSLGLPPHLGVGACPSFC